MMERILFFSDRGFLDGFGNLDMNAYPIVAVTSIIGDNQPVVMETGIDNDGNKIINVAKGTTTTDVATLENLADYVPKTDIANNLTTTDAGKVLDARQGKILNDGKLDKASSGGGYRAYVAYNDGTNAMQPISGDVVNNVLVTRRGNGFISIKSSNTASRPSTSLVVGDQYFNTTTGQMEIYIGDTNHWLNQKYSNGDTLPTPASGTSHTYLVVSSGIGR